MHEQETKVGIGNRSGYSRLVGRLAFVAMEGEDANILRVGTIVRLRADSQGYLRNFHDHDSVVIVGFQHPDTDGCADYIIFASNGTQVLEIKPSNIECVLQDAPRSLR